MSDTPVPAPTLSPSKKPFAGSGRGCCPKTTGGKRPMQTLHERKEIRWGTGPGTDVPGHLLGAFVESHIGPIEAEDPDEDPQCDAARGAVLRVDLGVHKKGDMMESVALDQFRSELVVRSGEEGEDDEEAESRFPVHLALGAGPAALAKSPLAEKLSELEDHFALTLRHVTGSLDEMSPAAFESVFATRPTEGETPAAAAARSMVAWAELAIAGEAPFAKKRKA